MSRCFPYPPSGCYMNGAAYDALIESIKLQKETVEAKAQRKNEKKAKKEEKRRKHKRNNEDLVNCEEEEAEIEKTKAVTELLFEKSDLTEEHGQPISPNSSDSTQNSNKRKMDDYSLVRDSSTGHGSFKIRLMKKQKDSDSFNLVTDARSNIHQTVPSSSNLDRIQTKSNPVFQGAKISDTNRLRFGFAKPTLQCNRPQEVLPQTYSEQHVIPTPSVSRNVEQQQQPTVTHRGMSNPVSNKTNASGGRTTNGISVPVNDGLTKQKDEPQKARLTRAEKKMMKKHAKYEKLIGSWLQPVFQADIPTDDDWLCSSKTSNSSISKREVETCREIGASWQPCARFLAEVDVHALPYTVPF